MIQKVVHKDNFTIIIGINKAIQYLLHESGIYTYKDLSQSSVKHIIKTTSKITPRHRESWPSQALLAEEHRWDKLYEFQYHLRNRTGYCRDNCQFISQSWNESNL